MWAKRILKPLAFVLVILLVISAISNVAISPTNIAATKKSSKSGLTQIQSESTDFPKDDQSAVEAHVTSAKKDSIGSYHVRGEIKNLSNDTSLQFVKVTA